jgi:5-methylcytosine-specific restriction protein A
MAAPLHVCAEYGCPTLIPRGQSRCALHAARPWAGAGKDYGPGWDRLRALVLREEPTCRLCGVRPSTTVDHIRAKARGGTDARSNLRALCDPCHASKSGREGGTAPRRPS